MRQLPTEQLVDIIWQQQQIIEQLQQEIERLKVSLQLNSQNSSKPPSSDLLKKSETPKPSSDQTTGSKRKPGGQPGHPRLAPALVFGRVDRYSILRPQQCFHCGSHEFVEQPVGIQRQQVAQLVACQERGSGISPAHLPRAYIVVKPTRQNGQILCLDKT